MSNLYEQVRTYYQLDTQIKELDQKKKPLNATIKAGMSAEGLTTLDCDGIVATYSTQERSSLNQDKLLAILEARGLDQAIETKRVPKPSVVEHLLYDGALSPADLADCTSVTFVEVLTVKAKKEKKNGKS